MIFQPQHEASRIGLLSGVVLLAFSLILALFLRGVYRIYFHPLSKIPGPKLYAATDFAFLYHSVRGTWPYKLKELHDKYGLAVRFSPRDVSFISADAWKDIYSHKNDATKNFSKNPLFYSRMNVTEPDIIVSNDHDHKRFRRLLSHAFSEKALRGQEDVIKHYVDLFIEKLTEKAKHDEVLDVVKWYNFLTFDLIGDLAFGEPFRCLEKGGYNPWVSMVFESVGVGPFWEAIVRNPWLKPLTLMLVPHKLLKSYREHMELSDATVRRRIDSGNTERQDFWSYILRHNDEKGMTKGEMVQNANVLIVAGSETTATLLSGATFRLLRNPDTYAKLVAEIRSSFSSEDEITMGSVNDLRYMLAVFEEAFRVYPPVPVGLPRVVPAGGSMIDGHWVPEGYGVSVAQWSAYRSPINWTEPDKFIPERWLGDKRFVNDARSVLNPFSVGPRNCIGKNLAYAEMRLILARLLFKFDLQLMNDSQDWNKQEIYTLWSKGALNVKLTLAQGGKVE